MNDIRIREKLSYGKEILDSWNDNHPDSKIPFEIVEELIVNRERWVTWRNSQYYGLYKQFSRKLPEGLWLNLKSLVLQE